MSDRSEPQLERAVGLVELLAARADVSVQRLGNARLIRSEDAAAFLEAAARAGVLVLGADGFRVDGADLVPELSAILDLSGLEDCAQSVKEAKSFVATVSEPGLFFEFVIQDGGG